MLKNKIGKQIHLINIANTLTKLQKSTHKLSPTSKKSRSVKSGYSTWCRIRLLVIFIDFNDNYELKRRGSQIYYIKEWNPTYGKFCLSEPIQDFIFKYFDELKRHSEWKLWWSQKYFKMKKVVSQSLNNFSHWS